MRNPSLKVGFSFFSRTLRLMPILLMLLAFLNALTTTALADQQEENAKAEHARELADSKRLILLKDLSVRVRPGARPAYSTLCDSVYAYADTHSANEVDLTGIGRDQFTAEDRQLVLDHFVETLHQVFDDRLPLATELDARTADATLNSIWRKLTAHGEVLPDAGSITVSGLRTAQRSWIKYRDALVAFTTLETGRGAAVSLFVKLTRERSDELGKLDQ
jgi:uncharacterized protein YecT (DUF1311 family)